MITIPEQLRKPQFKFIPVDNQKRPVEKDWPTKNNYSWDNLFKGKYKNLKHYGVVAGQVSGNLLIIDIEKEHKKLADTIKKELPDTFTVRTPSGGWHFYFVAPDFKEKIILLKTVKKDKNGNPIETVHYGELQWTGSQCLGPGSSYTSGNIKYTIENDIAIAEVKHEDVVTVVAPYYTPRKKIEFVSNRQGDQDWDISELVPELEKKGLIKDKSNTGVYKGEHPIHGSTSGQNFEIDTNENVWHCFRCQTGGDAVSLLAVLEGIVKCEDCTKGHFAKHKKEYLKTIRIGVKNYGFVDGRQDGYNSKYNNSSIKVRVFSDSPMKKGDLQVQNIVNYLQSKFTFAVIKDMTGKKPHIYVYDEGYYKLNGEDILINEFKEILNQQKIPWKEHYKNEILGYLYTENLIDREDINPPSNLINLNNGVYDLNTGKRKKHNPKYFFLYKIPWDFNPKANCPKIMKYLSSTLKPKYITFTQELFGYCLSFDYSIHGIFYLYGTGGNGKGVWADLLQALLGRQNVVNKSITSLASNRFATALLYGKLVNICGELGRGALYNTDILKKLSSGDSIQAEFKNKDGFDFKNKAKIITSCNSIPACNDLSYGWYRRQYIIPFLKKFSDSKQEIISLQSKLITRKEMEGLLRWSLQGLQRLRKNAKFSYVEDRQEQYIKMQENAQYFLNDNYIKAGASDIILFEDIYREYIKWCENNDVPFVSNASFGHALSEFLKAEVPPPNVDKKTGKKTYYRTYIKKL